MSGKVDDEIAIYEKAAAMAQSGSSLEAIKSSVIEMGVTEDKANTIAMEVTYYVRKRKEGQGNGTIVTGLLLLVVGIGGSVATDGQVLYYGAIIAGIVNLIIGIARNNRS